MLPPLSGLGIERVVEQWLVVAVSQQDAILFYSVVDGYHGGEVRWAAPAQVLPGGLEQQNEDGGGLPGGRDRQASLLCSGARGCRLRQRIFYNGAGEIYGFFSGLDWSGERIDVGVKGGIKDTEDTKDTEEAEETEDTGDMEDM